MSIQTASIPLGGTHSVTGGVATGLIVKNSSGSKVEAIIDDGSSFKAQTELDFTTKEPKPKADAPNGYTQRRNQVFINEPLVLANGNLTHNTVTIVVSTDIEASDTVLAGLREKAIHALFDADFQDFWNKQSLV